MKKMIVAVFALLVLIAAGGGLCRIYTLNRDADIYPVDYHQMQEKISLGDTSFYTELDCVRGYLLQIEKCELFGTEDFLKKYQIEKKDLSDETELPDMICALTVKFYNDNTKEEEAYDAPAVDLMRYRVVSDELSYSLEEELFVASNPDFMLVGSGFRLMPKSSGEFILPFAVRCEDKKSEALKEKFSRGKFYFVAGLYPEQERIILK